MPVLPTRHSHGRDIYITAETKYKVDSDLKDDSDWLVLESNNHGDWWTTLSSLMEQTAVMDVLTVSPNTIHSNELVLQDAAECFSKIFTKNKFTQKYIYVYWSLPFLSHISLISPFPCSPPFFPHFLGWSCEQRCSASAASVTKGVRRAWRSQGREETNMLELGQWPPQENILFAPASKYDEKIQIKILWGSSLMESSFV